MYERLIFKVKKLLKYGKDLKIDRTGGRKAKKQTFTAEIQRGPHKSTWNLAAKHKMAVNTMKRTVNKNVGMCSRVIQE